MLRTGNRNVIVLPFLRWNVPGEIWCLNSLKNALWHAWHSLTFVLLNLPSPSVELKCVCSLTCWGLLAGDVGFDIWWQVRGFRVLPWGQVGRHRCPGCHWRCWIPSHRWCRISRHHSSSAWLWKDDRTCLELQHIYPTRTGLNLHVSYPAHCSLCEGVISSGPSSWQTTLAIERLWLHIRQGMTDNDQFTRGWKRGCTHIYYTKFFTLFLKPTVFFNYSEFQRWNLVSDEQLNTL